MYTVFFGLKEIPFSIAPNPDYLFMSDRHREALAHLTYGLGDTGGFVLLTGEVGTGKTTISRCLMQQLPENIQTAFILNPTLSSQELLATICDELLIKYRKTGATLKTLTDKIQAKLLANHAKNINTVLIIDEAQHLQPEVLEQLRLLTNLETNTKKLLQVILIGQPELQQLLRRRDLRQLAQRITARYHLLPLNKQEVHQYIKHRLAIAECLRPIFSGSALRMIHKLSQGVPRLINLLCDRSLLTAYNINQNQVTRKIVLKASIEALGQEEVPKLWWQQLPVQLMFASAITATILYTGFWWGQQGELPSVSITITEPKIKPEGNVALADVSQDVIVTSVADNVAEMTSADQNNKVQPKQSKPQVTIDSEKIANKSINTSVKPQVKLVKKPEAVSEVEQSKSIEMTAVDGVSTQLLDRFQSAVADESGYTEQGSVNKQAIIPLKDMPEWLQKSIPKLDFDMHIYASDGEGWVRINSMDYYEGDNVMRTMVLEKILPQKVVLSYQGEHFSLPALASWPE